MKSLNLILIILFSLYIYSQDGNTYQGEGKYKYTEEDTPAQIEYNAKQEALKNAAKKFAEELEKIEDAAKYDLEESSVIDAVMQSFKNVEITDKFNDENNSEMFIRITASVKKDKVLNILEKDRAVKSRSGMIRDYLSLAMTAEENNRISEALQHYYWAMILYMNDKDKNSIEVPGNQEQSVTVFAASKIKKILGELNFKIDNKEDTEDKRVLYLNVTRGEDPVDVDFRYYSGAVLSDRIKADKGRAVVELTDADMQMNPVKLYVEYAYRDKASKDDYLSQNLDKAVMNFRNAGYLIYPDGKLKNNRTKINKDFKFTEGTAKKDIPLNKKLRSNKAWSYIGGGAAVIVGVTAVILLSDSDSKENPKSADIDIVIPLP